MLALLMAIVFFGASPPPATPAPMSDAAIEQMCRRYYKTAVCSEALGAWLPTYLGGSFGPSNRNVATRGVPADVFVFDHDGKSSEGPEGGTFFVYGAAGPPRGDIFYDPVHRLAFFTQGCCAWRETVLTQVVTPPPVAVRTTDLRGVHTKAGVTIGMHAADVMRRYGPSRRHPVPEHPDLQVLSYTSRRSAYDPHESCGTDQNFILKDDRVLYIQLGWAC
jgi:hypothetical protein